MALARFITTVMPALFLMSSNIFTGYITSQIFQVERNELFFPTKREQEEFKWPEKNATNPPSLPSQATTLLPSRATTVYMITSTKPRNTQKLDLTSLCQTLMHVSNLVWIVVESSSVKSRGVTKVLERCQVPSVHLNVPEHSSVLEQRNAGLKFLVETFCDMERCDGVVCFGNDGTKYDIRLFNEIIKTEGVSVYTVAFSGGLLVEGPLCKEGRVSTWMYENNSEASSVRVFPISTLGFAVHTDLLLQHPSIQFGMSKAGSWVEDEFVGTAFLEHLGLTQDQLECRSSDREVLVWNTQSEEPNVAREEFQESGPEILY